MTAEEVPRALDGERLDRVVAMIADVSRSAAARLVDAGAVRVDGTVETGRARRLLEGETVEVDRVDDPADEVPSPDPDVPIDVVHEDDEVLVVRKPPGLVVHPGAGHATGTLSQGLLARDPALAGVGQPDRPGIVHRLDRDTSGLLMVARTADAYDDLVAQLQARTVERRYRALVWGTIDEPAGRVDGPIGRSKRHPTRMAVTAGGREAMTDYEVIDRFTEPVVVSHLACRLHTGRTHQIRVHLASIGHTVVGDETYGGARQSLPVPRLWLHAETLGFTHPATGAPMRFVDPLPDDLQQVLDGLA